MMHRLVLFSSLWLFAGEAAWAHPGHGTPGWFHPHVSDIVFLVLAVVAGLALWRHLRK